MLKTILSSLSKKFGSIMNCQTEAGSLSETYVYGNKSLIGFSGLEGSTFVLERQKRSALNKCAFYRHGLPVL